MCHSPRVHRLSFHQEPRLVFAGQAEVVDLVNGSGIMNPLLHLWTHIAQIVLGPTSSLRSDVRVLTGGGLRP